MSCKEITVAMIGILESRTTMLQGINFLGFPELKQAGPFGSQVGALHHLARIKGLQRTLLTVQDPSDGTLAVFNTE